MPRLGKFFVWGVGDINGDGAHFSGPPSDQNAEHEQYTGLKDKNGKEIYEGDIVSDHLGVGVVEYREEKAAFRVVYGDGWAKWFLDYTLKGEKESIEVIGNIHEPDNISIMGDA